MACGHEGENGFLATDATGFIQNPSDPRCIHCAWDELGNALPTGWRFTRLSFLFTGWSAEIASLTGEIMQSLGSTPAEAMDVMTEQLKEKNRG